MRARNIKPGFFENELLVELPPAARLVFIGMWCMADREGRLEDRPKKIKLQILPYDSLDVDEYLNELARMNFITRYSVDGSKYIQIENFLKHQNPHQNESKSIIPPKESAQIEIAEALIQERITEEDAGFTKDDALKILRKEGLVTKEESTSDHGENHLQPCSPKVVHTRADSLNPDSLKNPPIPPRGGKAALPSWIDPDVWENFIAHRIAIKAKMSTSAQKLVLAKLEKLRDAGFDPSAVLNQSIENGWKGLFELKAGNGREPPSTYRTLEPDPEYEARHADLYGEPN